MKEAIFQIKNVYGNDLIYPVNELAVRLTTLTGKKTVSNWDLDQLRFIGNIVNMHVVVL